MILLAELPSPFLGAWRRKVTPCLTADSGLWVSFDFFCILGLAKGEQLRRRASRLTFWH